MKWKPLMAVLIGLLMIGVAAKAAPSPASSGGYDSETPVWGLERPIKPVNVSQHIFTGPGSVEKGKRFLKTFGGQITLELNFSELSKHNITFFAVVLRPIPNGKYAPIYFIGDGLRHEDIEKFRWEFQRVVNDVLNRPIEGRFSIASEPSREWHWIGSIRTITKSTSYPLTPGNAYQSLSSDYWYTEGTSGQYAYYAKVYHSGDMSSSEIAINELKLVVSAPTGYEFIGNGHYLPDGHGGPKTTYSESSSFGFDGTTLVFSASAGYNMETNDGYYFRWDTHAFDPNTEVTFRFYDFHRKYGSLSAPAWGKSFTARPAVIMIVEPSSTSTRAAVFKYHATASFKFNTWAGSVVKSTDPIDVTVFAFPWSVWDG
ncbi:hypothetical protein [Palaeococcus ferrophilus]|uniref:hypothetical protein n=1 Tax=Palaeococcus ferrophilus TaxID=83868 RepID=UPI00064F1611|nr:hypothetical protein [Palaeococcus ferrophilus]